MVDPRHEARRQRYLETLYELDGRADKSHPLHATYTGLLQQRTATLLAADFDTLTQDG